MSRSTSTTFFFAVMKLFAIFLEMKVFPSPALIEVHIMTWFFLSFLARKVILVRTILKASSTRFPLSFSCSGMTPRNGAVSLPWRSFLVRTLVSRKSFIRNMTPGTARPRRKPRRMILFLFGAIGRAGPEAESITLALLSTIACESAFSSRLLSRKRYRDSLIFCWRSIESIWRSLVGIEETLDCALDSRD